jgi:hypothetical protein
VKMLKEKTSHLSEDHSHNECKEEGNEVNVQEAINSLRALVSGEINASKCPLKHYCFP